MAKVLSSITLSAPAAPITPAILDTFTFTGTPGFTGTGGVQRYDQIWQVNKNGAGYVTIAASATGLITASTNPLVNTNSQTANSITVEVESSGSYVIRMQGAPTSGGSYTITSGTQTVTVAAAAQDLTPSLFTSATFAANAATITVGSVDVAPPLFTNTNSFYAATVTTGAVDLAPALFTNTNTFYAATVTVGAVDLTPGLFSNANTFYAATITTGAVDLTPGLYTNTNTFYAAAVTQPGIVSNQGPRRQAIVN